MISLVGKEERLGWIQYITYQLKENSGILERDGSVCRKVPVTTVLKGIRKGPRGERDAVFCLSRMSGTVQRWTRHCGKQASYCKQTSILLNAAGERRENVQTQSRWGKRQTVELTEWEMAER